MNTASTLRPGARDVAGVPDPLLGVGGRYVVGVDGSFAGRAALGWALARADEGAEVHLVAVADDDGVMGTVYAAQSARELAHRVSEIADDAAGLHPRLTVTSELVRGEVASALAAAARPSDLVVIGSDKTGFARGRVFGSRAVQLAASAHGSIAVVPSVDLRLRTGVAVAVADLETGAPLLRIAAHEARRRASAVAIVHAAAAGADAADLLAGAREVLHHEEEGIDCWCHVSRRHPAEAILNLSRDKALLLVRRSRETNPLGVGRTLHDVLMNPNAPTVVVG